MNKHIVVLSAFAMSIFAVGCSATATGEGLDATQSELKGDQGSKKRGKEAAEPPADCVEDKDARKDPVTDPGTEPPTDPEQDPRKDPGRVEGDPNAPPKDPSAPDVSCLSDIVGGSDSCESDKVLESTALAICSKRGWKLLVFSPAADCEGGSTIAKFACCSEP